MRLDGAWAAASSLLFADEIRGFVRITRSPVYSDLRIWAQGAAQVHAIGVDVVRRNLVGCLTALTPVFHCGDHGKLIRTRSAAAVIHSRDHEQAEPVVLVRTHFREDARVVIDAIQWRDGATGSSVVPSVVHQK